MVLFKILFDHFLLSLATTISKLEFYIFDIFLRKKNLESSIRIFKGIILKGDRTIFFANY